MTFHELTAARTFLLLLLIIVAGDMVFVLMHILQKLKFIAHTQFLLTTDGGFAEVYQYVKEGSIAVIFLWAAVKHRMLILLAWSVLFLFLLLDDSLQLHEKTGEVFAAAFEIKSVFNLAPRDIAQPLAVFLWVTPIFVLLSYSYYYASAAEKRMSHRMIMLVAAIGFFGVGVDLMHAAAPWGLGMFALIEEGGEMIVMSIMLTVCAYNYLPAFKQP
ncbi:hypothetical protein OPS25_01650 [Alteromonas ponticola]|uniref:Uncharacterized protein n=1 Tax=Alteromonas aquimaris TaxID=2998417 RepID=A0ABT3P381_9ALTE|nr:hypothetical protein [Alteromonas aquimaris]MCW8107208.1 hypothetical protein [Alteromonas aquimaris]